VDPERQAKGNDTYEAVYGDDGPNAKPPPGASLYVDVMIEQLFAEVWAREALSIRDRRLLVMGTLAAQGMADKVDMQLRRAVELGELTLDEADEVVLHLSHYVGWALASPLSMTVPNLRAEIAARERGHAT
jgi:4-carboxymuconolactone decarboxylase